MELKTAKKILNEMLDLCSQIEDPTLSDAAQGIYRDVQAAKSIQIVISAGRELLIFVNEVPDDDSISDVKAEIEDLYNGLLESDEDL